ncbi:hypothetical protein BH10PSE11_BH10PSE11_06120 [soil metagenome]
MNIPAREYFDMMTEGWLRAEQRGQSSERFYKIADIAFRIQFAGAPLSGLLAPPFSHLELMPGTDQVQQTIRIWDASATGVPMPPAPCSKADFTARGEFKDFHDGRFYAAYQPLSRTLSVFDSESGVTVICISDIRQMPSYERAVPFRPVFGWIMPLHKRQLVHAASVGTASGGVLIVGHGGAGKSNTATGSLIGGLSFVSDDFCAVSKDPKPAVYSLYGTSRTHENDWATLPYPKSNPEDPSEEKSLHYLQTYFPGRIVAGFPLLAMLLPRRNGVGLPTLSAAPSASAIVQMSSQSAAMLPDAGGEVLTRLSGMLRNLPTYHLNLGTSPQHIPFLIRSLIEELSKGRHETSDIT